MCDFLSVVDPLSGSCATLVRLPKRLLAIGRSRSRDLGQVSNSYQVVGGGSELKDPTHQLQSAVTGLTQQPHRLQPAEDFFHSFADRIRSLRSLACVQKVVRAGMNLKVESAAVGDPPALVALAICNCTCPLVVRCLPAFCSSVFGVGPDYS